MKVLLSGNGKDRGGRTTRTASKAVAPTILYAYSDGGTYSISDLISALRPEIWGRRDSDSGATIKVESG